MRKFYVTLSLLCVLYAIPMYTIEQTCNGIKWEYQRQGNPILGNPWYKDVWWYIRFPFFWDQLEQDASRLV